MQTSYTVSQADASRPLYLDWVQKWKFPKLHDRPHKPRKRVPTQLILTYKISERLCLLNDVLNHLVRERIIRGCLNLSDGQGIIDRWESYPWPFTSMALWGSVAEDSSGNLFVPRLQIIRDQLPIIYWIWLEYPYSPETIPILIRS